jgi:hypothetical protein
MACIALVLSLPRRATLRPIGGERALRTTALNAAIAGDL